MLAPAEVSVDPVREHAARLLGATDEYHRKFQCTRSPLEREERSNAIAIMREAMGEVAFKKAWEERMAMTEEQAIACAREELLNSSPA